MHSEKNIIHTFDFKAENRKTWLNGHGIAVGIVSKCSINNFFKRPHSHNETFWNRSGCISYGVLNSGKMKKKVEFKSFPWKEGDTVSLIVDFDKKEIGAYLNGNVSKTRVLFTDI